MNWLEHENELLLCKPSTTTLFQDKIFTSYILPFISLSHPTRRQLFFLLIGPTLTEKHFSSQPNTPEILHPPYMAQTALHKILKDLKHDLLNSIISKATLDDFHSSQELISFIASLKASYKQYLDSRKQLPDNSSNDDIGSGLVSIMNTPLDSIPPTISKFFAQNPLLNKQSISHRIYSQLKGSILPSPLRVHLYKTHLQSSLNYKTLVVNAAQEKHIVDPLNTSIMTLLRTTLANTIKVSLSHTATDYHANRDLLMSTGLEVSEMSEAIFGVEITWVVEGMARLARAWLARASLKMAAPSSLGAGFEPLLHDNGQKQPANVLHSRSHFAPPECDRGERSVPTFTVLCYVQ